MGLDYGKSSYIELSNYRHLTVTTYANGDAAASYIGQNGTFNFSTESKYATWTWEDGKGNTQVMDISPADRNAIVTAIRQVRSNRYQQMDDSSAQRVLGALNHALHPREVGSVSVQRFGNETGIEQFITQTASNRDGIYPSRINITQTPDHMEIGYDKDILTIGAHLLGKVVVDHGKVYATITDSEGDHRVRVNKTAEDALIAQARTTLSEGHLTQAQANMLGALAAQTFGAQINAYKHHKMGY